MSDIIIIIIIAACDNGAGKFKSYWVPIYTLGSRAAMWINCLAEGQKRMAMVRFEPGLSAWESSEYHNASHPSYYKISG